VPVAKSEVAEHTVVVLAPAEAVYQVIADVTKWPRYFSPTVHVEYLERSDTEERIRIWATANGSVKSWVSRRQLDPQALRIEFRQEVSAPPVGAMGGTWILQSLTPSETLVVLRHDFRAVDDDPEGLRWITEAVDRNSTQELAGLKEVVERRHEEAALLFSFEDTVSVAGSASDVYEFLYRAKEWPQRLPHVARMELTEDIPDLQVMEMDTRTKDGSTHTTKSIRVCFPDHSIVYKQIGLPALLTLHTGEWRIVRTDHGVDVTSEHTVAIKPSAIAGILGPDATVADARKFVQTALSTNSGATLNYARQFAEARRA
jgi:aromatase